MPICRPNARFCRALPVAVASCHANHGFDFQHEFFYTVVTHRPKNALFGATGMHETNRPTDHSIAYCPHPLGGLHNNISFVTCASV